MRRYVLLPLFALVLSADAFGNFAYRCGRWFVLGAVSVTTLSAAPHSVIPPEKEFVSPKSPQKLPWRQYEFSLSKKFFFKTPLHRTMAGRINGIARSEEPDPKLQALMADDEMLTAELTSVNVWREGNWLQFGWATRTQEALFPGRVRAEDFADGKEVTVDGTLKRDGTAGKLRVQLSATFSVDPRTGRMHLRRARVEAEASSLFGTVVDDVNLAPAVGREATLPLVPQRPWN